MGAGGYIAIGVGLFLILFVIGMYNNLVRARQRVKESWSDVDTELARRHDLIPNLVATVKGYMTHEREVLTRLTELRGQAEGMRDGPLSRRQAGVEGEIGRLLGQVSMRVEAYPDLKASGNVLALQGELANTEDRIAAALRFYNGNVRDLNVRCEAFPSNLVAGMFGFKTAEFFKIEESARSAPRAEV